MTTSTPRRRRERRYRAQRLNQNIRVVRFDRANPARTETETRENGICERDRLRQPRDVVTRSGGQQKAQRGRTIRESGSDVFEPDLRHLVEAKRQHIGRQPVAVPRQRVDQRLAMRRVMQQQMRKPGRGIPQQPSGYQPPQSTLRPRR